MTAQAIITRALGLAGKLMPGRTPSSSESTYCLGLLNALIDNYNHNRIYVAGLDTISQALSSGVSEYTLSTRPIHIESAAIVTTAGGLTWRQPLKIARSTNEAADIPNAGITTPFPVALYCDYGTPDAKVWIFPAPGTGTLYVKHWYQLGSFATLGTDITLVAGVERALVHGLALEVVSAYPQYCKLTPELQSAAADTRSALAKLHQGHASPADASAGPGVAA